jgi:hypothetical protein
VSKARTTWNASTFGEPGQISDPDVIAYALREQIIHRLISV